jgi:hypothetical protein
MCSGLAVAHLGPILYFIAQFLCSPGHLIPAVAIFDDTLLGWFNDINHRQVAKWVGATYLRDLFFRWASCSFSERTLLYLLVKKLLKSLYDSVLCQ